MEAQRLVRFPFGFNFVVFISRIEMVKRLYLVIGYQHHLLFPCRHEVGNCRNKNKVGGKRKGWRRRMDICFGTLTATSHNSEKKGLYSISLLWGSLKQFSREILGILVL